MAGSGLPKTACPHAGGPLGNDRSGLQSPGPFHGTPDDRFPFDFPSGPAHALRQFDLTQVASHLLRRAHFRAEALFAQAFPDEDLTPRQKALLITVYQNPGATQNRVAELIALDRNSFAEMIARMTAKGYVRRTRSTEDGRAYALEITDEGAALLARVLPRDAEVEAQVLAPIPQELRPVFLQCLRLMAGLEPPAAS